MRTIFALGLVVLAAPAVVSAQQARPSIFAVDTVAAFEQTLEEGGITATGLTFDSVISADLGHGLQGITRPFVQRSANSGEWNRQIWLATLRYERSGPVAVRLDGGYIAPPIGLANLNLRPHLNPTISHPSSLYSGLPPLQPGAPRATLLGALYPLGAVGTVSGLHWDARGGVIDTSPLRTRRVFSQTNPPQFANVFLGGGVTPVVGLRIGASVTHGGWLRAGETPSVTANRDATVFTAESEFSFRYTKLSAEWVRSGIETDLGDRMASGWFVQGQQTLTPRWFAAARVERMSSSRVSAQRGTTDAPASVLVSREHLTGVEETLGFRVSPDITFRIGHRARRGFGVIGYAHQGSVSIVWAKRWM
jgi:hypothetical protein